MNSKGETDSIQLHHSEIRKSIKYQESSDFIKTHKK
jgi:hypothetical protein